MVRSLWVAPLCRQAAGCHLQGRRLVIRRRESQPWRSGPEFDPDGDQLQGCIGIYLNSREGGSGTPAPPWALLQGDWPNPTSRAGRSCCCCSGTSRL